MMHSYVDLTTRVTLYFDFEHYEWPLATAKQKISGILR